MGTTGTETQKTFASPAEAGKAFLEAARSGDQAALLAIFGPDGKEVLFSGDPVKDKNALRTFVAAYETMNRWGKINGGGQMLYVGPENFPFPIPLLADFVGPMVFRHRRRRRRDSCPPHRTKRIGRDRGERRARQRASRSTSTGLMRVVTSNNTPRSSSATKASTNGLYWPASEGQTQSPLGQLGDFAKGAGYTNTGDKPQPFNGYYFRILTKQGNTAKGGAKDYVVNGKMTGGFAILAYPAEYRNSGIMTFLRRHRRHRLPKRLGAQRRLTLRRP